MVIKIKQNLTNLSYKIAIGSCCIKYSHTSGFRMDEFQMSNYLKNILPELWEKYYVLGNHMRSEKRDSSD